MTDTPGDPPEVDHPEDEKPATYSYGITMSRFPIDGDAGVEHELSVRYESDDRTARPRTAQAAFEAGQAVIDLYDAEGWTLESLYIFRDKDFD